MRILIIFCFLFLYSCNEKYSYKFKEIGNINSLRLDDDGEYHFFTDEDTYYDITPYQILIKRKIIKTPKLFYLQEKSNYSSDNKFYDVGFAKHQYLIILPVNYEIQTFND